MSYALTRYTGNGSRLNYTIGFPFRETADVVVKVDGVTKTQGQDYTFTSGNGVIQFTVAPALNANVLITRSTSQSTRLVDYTAGAVFKEADLDTDSIQSFNMAQEAIDIANDAISKDANNRYDAQNSRIINVADPVDIQDAATKSYVQQSVADFNNRYYGESATAPTSPSPAVGDLWYDSTNNVMKVYANTGWQQATSAVATSSNRVVYTAGVSSGAYTGSAYTFPAAYDSGFVDVYRNGVKLVNGTDFTATNGSTVVLNSATNLGDTVDIVAYGATTLASINTVAGNISNITTVASDIEGDNNIETVADAIANITTVANNTSNINSVAADLNSDNNIETVADAIANVNTVAGISSDVTTVANNVTDVTNFADVYQSGKANDPSTRNDGSALQVGDLYFNTTNDELRVYSGSAWQSIKAGSLNVQNFTGDGSDTTFVLSSDPGNENNTQIYIDGVYQQKDTYSLSGSTITFSEAPPNLSDIEVVVISSVSLGTTAADLVTYTPAGTGAVDTTVQTKLRESVSVKDFGAVGDGVTDDTAAFEAAESAGMNIYVPNTNGTETTYILDGTFRIDNARSMHIEDGVTLKLAPDSPSESRIININKSNFSITGLGSLDGNRATQVSTPALQRLIFCSAQSNINITLKNITGATDFGIFMRDNTDSSITIVGEATNCGNVLVYWLARNGFTVKNCITYLKFGDRSDDAANDNGLVEFNTQSSTQGRIENCHMDVAGKMSNSPTGSNVVLFEFWGPGSGNSIHCRYAEGGTIGCSIARQDYGSINCVYAYDQDEISLELADCSNSRIEGNINGNGNTTTGAVADGSNLGANNNTINITGEGTTGQLAYAFRATNTTIYISGKITSGKGLRSLRSSATQGYGVIDAGGTSSKPLTWDAAGDTISGGGFRGTIKNATSQGLELLVGDGSLDGLKFNLQFESVSGFVNENITGSGSFGTQIEIEWNNKNVSNAKSGKYFDFKNKRGNFVVAGTPDGSLTAGVGSTANRTNGGAGTSFYVKESGTGNTGWVAK